MRCLKAGRQTRKIIKRHMSHLEGLIKQFLDVERISKEAEEQLDDLGYDDAFLRSYLNI